MRIIPNAKMFLAKTITFSPLGKRIAEKNK